MGQAVYNVGILDLIEYSDADCNGDNIVDYGQILDGYACEDDPMAMECPMNVRLDRGHHGVREPVVTSRRSSRPIECIDFR